MEIRILGPLEVARDGEPLVLGAVQQRALLAVLVLHRGEVVSTDRLVDELWGERAPAAAAKTVQVYVSHLRKALGAQPGARPVSAATDNGGNPNAAPPILPPLRPSELAELRRAEAQQWQALSYRLPAGARYSNVEMDVFAAEGYVRS